jgi:hypothetical protein
MSYTYMIHPEHSALLEFEKIISFRIGKRLGRSLLKGNDMSKRVPLAALTAVVTIGLVCYALLYRDMPRKGDRQIVVKVPSSPVPKQPERRTATVQAMVQTAGEAWSGQDISSNDIAALAMGMESVLIAYVESDFSAYESYMQRIGASLSRDRAEAVVRKYLRKSYSGDSDLNWEVAPIKELVAAAWNRPDRRGATWMALDPKLVTAGTGWRLGPDETAKGVAILFTLYDFPGRDRLIQEAQANAIPSAWIQFPVVFSDGVIAEVRITFAYDEQRRAWMPLRLMTLGTEPKPLMLF